MVVVGVLISGERLREPDYKTPRRLHPKPCIFHGCCRFTVTGSNATGSQLVLCQDGWPSLLFVSLEEGVCTPPLCCTEAGSCAWVFNSLPLRQLSICQGFFISLHPLHPKMNWRACKIARPSVSDPCNLSRIQNVFINSRD